MFCSDILTLVWADLSIDAQQYKVFPGTESKIYHDRFFMAQDLVVNALDNVEARRYVDRYEGLYWECLVIFTVVWFHGTHIYLVS